MTSAHCQCLGEATDLSPDLATFLAFLWRVLRAIGYYLSDMQTPSCIHRDRILPELLHSAAEADFVGLYLRNDMQLSVPLQWILT